MKSRLVQVRLQPRTLSQLESLHEMTGTENRTRIVEGCIETAEMIARAQHEGGRVLVERPDGSREYVRFVGL